jgi:hypothetical protein
MFMKFAQFSSKCTYIRKHFVGWHWCPRVREVVEETSPVKCSWAAIA